MNMEKKLQFTTWISKQKPLLAKMSVSHVTKDDHLLCLTTTKCYIEIYCSLLLYHCCRVWTKKSVYIKLSIFLLVLVILVLTCECSYPIRNPISWKLQESAVTLAALWGCTCTWHLIAYFYLKKYYIQFLIMFLWMYSPLKYRNFEI